MKKTLLIVLVFLSILTSTKTYSQAHEKGDLSISVAGGIPLALSFKDPIFYGLADYGISDRISLGAFAGFNKSNNNSSVTGYDRYTIIGVNAKYHLDLGFERLDLNIGTSVSNNFITSMRDFGGFTTTTNSSSISVGAILGANIFISENLKLFVDYGYGTASGLLGFGYKF